MQEPNEEHPGPASLEHWPALPGGKEKLSLPQLEARLRTLKKKKVRRGRVALALVLIDLLSIVVAFMIASLIRTEAMNWLQIGRSLEVFIPIYYAISLNLNVHNAQVVESPKISIWKVVGASATTAMSVILVIFFLGASEYFSRQIFAVGVGLSIVLMVAGRLLVAWQGRRYLGPSPYAHLCIYDQVELTERSGPGAIQAAQLDLHPDLNDIDFITRLGKMAESMDKVIVHCRPERRAEWVRVLQCLDVDTELAWPELDQLQPIALRYRGGSVSLQITTGKLKWHQRFLKRTFDLAISLAILPGLLPLLALVALAVRLESKGPVFFRQPRIGLGNRPFIMLKFRSMYVDKCDDRGTGGTQLNDARVTRVGAFIRRTSIDELPQFLNVLKGDMSIVGPRPHPPKAMAGGSLFWEVDLDYWRRHVLKPGITGLAQVRGHRGNTFSEQHLRDRLESDLEYVENWSLLGDLGIFLRTLTVSVHKNAF